MITFGSQTTEMPETIKGAIIPSSAALNLFQNVKTLIPHIQDCDPNWKLNLTSSSKFAVKKWQELNKGREPGKIFSHLPVKEEAARLFSG